MGQELYRWDDGGVLKHHCPICHQPLSHEKCRTTCLGKHVEWCHRYHSLFRLTWAARCSACKNCDEQHEKRHRDIAEIWHRIKKHMAEQEALLMERPISPAVSKMARTPLTAKALSTMESPMTPTNSAEKMTKKARKAAKKAAKAMDRDKFVTTADILRVAKTLHPEPEKDIDAADADAELFSEDQDIKWNLGFNYSTCNTNSMRQSYIPTQRSSHYQVPEADIERFLEQLEVNINAVGKEGELVADLVKAIKSDLIHFHDEVEGTARNKAGFWRWANKKAYRALMDRGKAWEDKHKPIETSVAEVVEERRDEELNSDQEGEDHPSRISSHNSVVPSLTRSASTKSESIALPNPASDSGGTQVGKKAMSAQPRGKFTLAANGGLEHLHLKPKSNFGALSWSDVARGQ